MMAELEHRVKNNLMEMLALAEQTASSSESVDTFIERYSGRLYSMARTHDALSAKKWTGIDLEDIIRLVVLPCATDPNSMVHLHGESIELPVEAASAFCLTIHELAMNALKYGALQQEDGRVNISWNIDSEGIFHFQWQEQLGQGITLAEPAPESGGMSLIQGLVGHELSGQVKFEFLPTGLQCELVLPLWRHQKQDTLDTAG